ncbi:ABC transporter substrate-binding protein [Thermoproteota archaeon]
MSEGISNNTKIIAAIIISLVIGASIGYLMKPSKEEEISVLTDRVNQLEAQVSELQSSMLPDPIKIGHILPLTGPLGVYSEGFLKGVQLAVWEINQQGGIAGHQIELIEEDSETDAIVAAEAAHKLIDIDNVQVIIGAYASACTYAVAPYAEQTHVVMISPATTGVALSTAGEYIFRVVPSDSGQAAAIADLVLNEGYNTAATIVLDSPYGVGIEETFTELFEAAGGEVVKSIRYELGAATYKTELGLIQDSDPDVIIDVSYADDGQIIFKEASELGMNTPWICAEGIADDKIFEAPGVGNYMSMAGEKGMIGTRPLSTENPASVNFKKMWKEHFGEDYAGQIYGDYAYDAAKVALMAVAYAGNYDGEAIKDALFYSGLTYKGASGDKTFDEFGDVAGDYIIWNTQLIDDEYAFVTIGKWSLSVGLELNP